MGILSWIILGLIAGYHRQQAGQQDRPGHADEIVLGIVGAVVGGYLATLLGMGGVSGFNLCQLLIAIGGAVVVQVIYRAFTGSSRL